MNPPVRRLPADPTPDSAAAVRTAAGGPGQVARLRSLLDDLYRAYRRRDAGWLRDWPVTAAGAAGLVLTFFGTGVLVKDHWLGPGGVFAGLVIAGCVVGGAAGWRRARAAAASREVEDRTGAVAGGYPAVVAHWGGPEVLDRPDVVRHLAKTLTIDQAHRAGNR